MHKVGNVGIFVLLKLDNRFNDYISPKGQGDINTKIAPANSIQASHDSERIGKCNWQTNILHPCLSLRKALLQKSRESQKPFSVIKHVQLGPSFCLGENED